MKIGYPCINNSVECKGTRTFRLKSYSPQRLVETVDHNLRCLGKILEFNVKNGMLFFRISSDIVPFASHPVCDFSWQEHFSEKLAALGNFARNHSLRISMHPDQFTLLNSKKKDVVQRSVQELIYHAEVLDLMKLDPTAKIQIHVGGVYGDKPGAMRRFACEYRSLPAAVQNRLVLENDDRHYTLADCLSLHADTGVPVLFDVFHHKINSSGEAPADALKAAAGTWTGKDGLMMTDYSSQRPGGRPGQHVEDIDEADFRDYLAGSAGIDFDIMLEIKNKEKSAAKALAVAAADPRLIT